MATLHLMCGKIASGKSTLAKELARNGLLFTEDRLQATLYPDMIHTFEDFVTATGRIRAALRPHFVTILEQGQDLVLDFQANTPKSRAWAKTLADDAGARLIVHYCEVSDDECKRRLALRNASGEHEYQVDETMFDQFTALFVEPDEAEEIEIAFH